MKGEGVGCVLVSHDLHDVVALSDRIAVMKGGVLVGIRAADAVEHETLLSMILTGHDPARA